MDDIVIKLTAEFLKTLAHPARIQILKMLVPSERCVCEFIPDLGIEQSNLSQHLGILKKQGLIGSRKEGTKVYYYVLYPAVFELIAIVEKILSDQISQSQGLLRHLK